MNAKSDLSPIKQIPIIEVAKRLGIQVRGTKAMCFSGHDKASPSLSSHCFVKEMPLFAPPPERHLCQFRSHCCEAAKCEFYISIRIGACSIIQCVYDFEGI